ncbi:MAG: transposase [Sphingobacteriaceae bacterium]|nr:transposase [Sphingobacteriaceae bacterium]
MAFAYVVKDQQGVYFVTFTVHQWADVFTRQIYADEFTNSLRYCQEQKGLEIFGWVIMSNHCHLILRAAGRYSLSEIMRDLKKHTSKKIYRAIQENAQESRKTWLLKVLNFDGKIWFWKKAIMVKK